MLNSAGFDYPVPLGPFPAHQELAWCLMKDQPQWADKVYDPKEVLTYYKKIATESTFDTLILSSEDLCSLDTLAASVERLRETFADFEVTILAYLRPQVEFLISLYHHAVRHGEEVRSFLCFLDESVNLRIVQYERRLSVWSKVFGSEHLRLRHYRDANLGSGGLLQDFFAAVGLEVTIKHPLPRVNVGVHPWLSKAYRQLNKLEVQGSNFAAEKTSLLKLGAKLPPVDSASYYLNPNELMILGKTFEETNRILKNQFDFVL